MHVVHRFDNKYCVSNLYVIIIYNKVFHLMLKCKKNYYIGQQLTNTHNTNICILMQWSDICIRMWPPNIYIQKC